MKFTIRFKIQIDFSFFMSITHYLMSLDECSVCLKLSSFRLYHTPIVLSFVGFAIASIGFAFECFRITRIQLIISIDSEMSVYMHRQRLGYRERRRAACSSFSFFLVLCLELILSSLKFVKKIHLQINYALTLTAFH